MINGVLVERTVKDVLPQLTTNADGLKKVLDDLLKQYSSKQEELEKWKVCRPRREETVLLDRNPANKCTSGRTRSRLCNSSVTDLIR